MYKKTSGIIFILMFLTAGVAATLENPGAPEINLDSGSKKSVDFPHKKHQDILKDCSVCHSLFSKEKGIIRESIDSGSMKKKTVMKECRACHKKMKKEGKQTGPTACGKCHSGK